MLCSSRLANVRPIDMYGDYPYSQSMTMTTQAPKTARIDLRLPRHARELITQAAALSGVSITDYILGAVLPVARRDLLEDRTIHLSKDEFDHFIQLLNQPDTEALAELRSLQPEWGTSR